jgi:hypothetical protein
MNILNNIIDWIKNIFQQKKEVETLSLPEGKKTKMYLHDPSVKDLVIEEEINQTILHISALGDQGGGYQLGTIQQQASACKGMVNHALQYMTSKTSKKVTKWAATNILTILPRAGKDVNAYYDRGSLKFFFFGDTVIRKNVFACDSRSVVTHEFGHAYLDILRPDFWSTQSSEVWAFHEAFGDITALLENIRHDQLIERAIQETNGDLSKSNILSRLASEMGIGLYHILNGKDGLSYCLRDLTIAYNYTEPEKLPSSGPDNQIVNECHSFSRIFSSAYYEIIIKMMNFNMKNGQSQIDALKSAGDTAATYIIEAALKVPNVLRLFNALAKQIIYTDKAHGGKYQDILNEVFLNRNILKETVIAQGSIHFDNVKANISDPFEVQVHGNKKMIRTLSNRKVKLSNSGKVFAMDDNPMLNLEIEIPNQTCYYFDESNHLCDMIEAQDSELFDAAYVCLDFLHKNHLFGNHEKALFEEKDGKLIRKQIVCKCNKPNYCDPNAPEYGKPWKPKNNAGCSACKSTNCEPRSCDCETPTLSQPAKTGCFTYLKSGNGTSYKFGQSISRRVC